MNKFSRCTQRPFTLRKLINKSGRFLCLCVPRRESAAAPCWDCGEKKSRRGHGCLLSCGCFVLLGSGLCDRSFPRPEELYPLHTQRMDGRVRTMKDMKN